MSPTTFTTRSTTASTNVAAATATATAAAASTATAVGLARRTDVEPHATAVDAPDASSTDRPRKPRRRPTFRYATFGTERVLVMGPLLEELLDAEAREASNPNEVDISLDEDATP